MKHLTGVLTTALLLAAMTLTTGCSKEEDNNNDMVTSNSTEREQFTIDMEQVSLLVGDDYKVTPSGAFSVRSTDEDVATVSAEGVIHGVSAGEAEIIFTAADGAQSRTCKVNVDWKYKYFDEPILDFNMSVEELKERETHPLVAENWWDVSKDGITDEAPDPYIVHFSYENEDMAMYAYYAFLDKKMPAITGIGIKVFKGTSNKILQQLEERYGTPNENGNHKIYSHRKGLYYILYNHANIIYSTKSFE